MKFTVKKSNLSSALQSLLPIIERAQTLMILSHVLVDIGDGKITLTTTNLDAQIVASAEAETQEQGRFTAPVRRLYDVIKNVDDSGLIKFSVNERVSVTTPTGRYQLSMLPANDFPVLDELKKEVLRFTIDQALLRQYLQWVKPAMGVNDVRYYLNGALMTMVNSRLVLISTDGHRLAKVESDSAEFEWDDDLTFEDWKGVVIPNKAVSAIQAMLSDKDDSVVNVAVSDNMIVFNFNGISFTSKLIDGRFPDYVRAIPADNNKKALVNRKNWINAIKNTSSLINKDKGIELLFESGNLVISARNPEQETGSETIAIEYSDDSVHIGFGYVYVLDALNALPGDDVRAFLNDGGTGIVLRPADDDVDLLHVISPMRL